MEQGTSGLCIQQCASTDASFQRSAESRDIAGPRAGTLQRGEEEADAAVDAAKLAADPRLALIHRRPSLTPAKLEAGLDSEPPPTTTYSAAGTALDPIQLLGVHRDSQY